MYAPFLNLNHFTDFQLFSFSLSVGNKNECPELKTVATQDAQRLAAKYSCLFIETSAKSDENVDQFSILFVQVSISDAHPLYLECRPKGRIWVKE
ncbi:hypothetical protein AHF37_06545 [Paragonimus kellicotti]|nr:hypothetical protein AHF37_06545 [Paragonimus kellicotti]